MKKKVVALFLTVVFVLTAFSMYSMVSKVQADNAASIQCTTQGDFMPAPFEEVTVEKSSISNNQDMFCSIQGDIMPPPFEDDEDTTTSTK
ncbi:MAG: hypothetical protein H8E11_00850 [Candidatus Cloacimonetes bacterium]|nr:hypothetical protein [Candidatus Cloacimonadota bacterium]